MRRGSDRRTHHPAAVFAATLIEEKIVPLQSKCAGAEDVPRRIYDFKVLLEPDENGGYVAVCPALAGCYSQNDAIAEAMANIKEAIGLCLEDMRARGEAIPDPSGVPVGSVVVTAE